MKVLLLNIVHKFSAKNAAVTSKETR